MFRSDIYTPLEELNKKFGANDVFDNIFLAWQEQCKDTYLKNSDMLEIISTQAKNYWDTNLTIYIPPTFQHDLFPNKSKSAILINNISNGIQPFYVIDQLTNIISEFVWDPVHQISVFDPEQNKIFTDIFNPESLSFTQLLFELNNVKPGFLYGYSRRSLHNYDVQPYLFSQAIKVRQEAHIESHPEINQLYKSLQSGLCAHYEEMISQFKSCLNNNVINVLKENKEISSLLTTKDFNLLCSQSKQIKLFENLLTKISPLKSLSRLNEIIHAPYFNDSNDLVKQNRIAFVTAYPYFLDFVMTESFSHEIQTLIDDGAHSKAIQCLAEYYQLPSETIFAIRNLSYGDLPLPFLSSLVERDCIDPKKIATENQDNILHFKNVIQHCLNLAKTIIPQEQMIEDEQSFSILAQVFIKACSDEFSELGSNSWKTFDEMYSEQNNQHLLIRDSLQDYLKSPFLGHLISCLFELDTNEERRSRYLDTIEVSDSAIIFLLKDLSLDKLIQFSKRWHSNQVQAKLKKLKDYNNASWETIFPTQQIPETIIAKKDWTIVPLTTASELEDEGKNAQHCVDTYVPQCLLENSHILSIRDEHGNSHSTIELKIIPLSVADLSNHNLIVLSDQNHVLEIAQHFGHFNTMPDKTNQLALDWLRDEIQKGNIKIDCEHLETARKIRKEKLNESKENKLLSKFGYDVTNQTKLREIKEAYRDVLQENLKPLKNNLNIVYPILNQDAETYYTKNLESISSDEFIHISQLIDAVKTRTTLQNILDKDFNVNAKKDGFTALHIAVQMNNTDAALTLIDYLIKKKSSVHLNADNGETPIEMAAEKGNITIIKRLLEDNALSKLMPQEKMQLINDLFMIAAKSGHIDVLVFLQEKGAKIDSFDPEGLTPLMHSVKENKIAVIEYLLREGASPVRKTKDGTSALSLAETNQMIKNILIFADLIRKAEKEFHTFHQHKGKKLPSTGNQMFNPITDKHTALFEKAFAVDAVRFSTYVSEKKNNHSLQQFLDTFQTNKSNRELKQLRQ